MNIKIDIEEIEINEEIVLDRNNFREAIRKF